MAGSESDYSDAYGLPHEQQAQWGAKAEQERQAAALKGMNPSASQYTNLNPGTAPTSRTVGQRASQLQRGAVNVQPKAPVQPAQQQPQPPQREMGQKPGVPPTPQYGFGQQPKAPLGGKYSRGYGPNAGLLPEDDPSQRGYNGGTSHYWRALGALPNASPEVQWFARQA